jgi:Transposase DDE domain
MMGSNARIFSPIAVVSLEDLVPAKHFYRQTHYVVDVAVSMRPVWIEFAPISQPRPTRRPCKRSVWVEPLFAEGKQRHGMRRFRLRLLWRVNCEDLMIAAGQNLKRLLKSAVGDGARAQQRPCVPSFWLLLGGLPLLFGGVVRFFVD